MRLTEAELEEGRAHVRAKDLAALERWVDARRINISRILLHDSFGRAMRDPELAMKLFDRAFPGMDPEAERRIFRIRLAVAVVGMLLTTLGCIGGIVYLMKSVF